MVHNIKPAMVANKKIATIPNRLARLILIRRIFLAAAISLLTAVILTARGTCKQLYKQISQMAKTAQAKREQSAVDRSLVSLTN